MLRGPASAARLGPAEMCLYFLSHCFRIQVLCERLHDEPEAVEEVWSELCQQKLEVSHPYMNILICI